MNRTTIRRAGITLATSAALVAGAGLAYASIPDGGGVITGCYNSTSGALRVIDAAKTKCSSSERALTWNQQGQPGPAGPAGPIGGTGPQGPQGPQGPAGVSGYEIKASAEIELEPGNNSAHWVYCPDGKVAFGGGYYTSRWEGEVSASMPLFNSDKSQAIGWSVSTHNTSTDVTAYLHLWAICGYVD